MSVLEDTRDSSEWDLAQLGTSLDLNFRSADGKVMERTQPDTVLTSSRTMIAMTDKIEKFCESMLQLSSLWRGG